jgi:hypothetical protein
VQPDGCEKRSDSATDQESGAAGYPVADAPIEGQACGVANGNAHKDAAAEVGAEGSGHGTKQACALLMKATEKAPPGSSPGGA